MRKSLVLTAGALLLLAALAASLTALLLDDHGMEGQAGATIGPKVRQDAAAETTEVASGMTPIETSDFARPKAPHGQLSENGDATAQRGSRYVSLRDPGGDRAFIARLRSAGIPSEEIASFMQLPLDMRLERWELAGPLVKTIAYNEGRVIETKRDAAIVQAFQGNVARITGTEESLTSMLMADPGRYGMTRDRKDGSAFLIDLSALRFDDATLTRVADFEAKAAKDRQALLQVIRGN